jgi:hypothetical protein
VDNPLLALALGIDARPGAYALLLGSGISQAAGIPTGYEITLDLVRRLATARDERAAAEPDPAGWYRATFGEEANYDTLMEALAPTEAMRAALLRGYFEPTAEERERGEKLPTPAHRAIARLARAGAVRVLLTTNFDRLLEQALEAEGEVPAVAYTPDMVAGMLPLAHAPCTLVKLHGDYLDTRLRNMPAELATYPPALNRLLDQVFDEYGLLVCG